MLRLDFACCLMVAALCTVSQAQLRDRLEAYNVYKHSLNENEAGVFGGDVAYLFLRGTQQPPSSQPWVKVKDNVLSGDLGSFNALSDSSQNLKDLGDVAVRIYACRLTYQSEDTEIHVGVLSETPCKQISSMNGTNNPDKVRELFTFLGSSVQTEVMNTMVYAGICTETTSGGEVYLYGKISAQENVCNTGSSQLSMASHSFYANVPGEYISCNMEERVYYDAMCRLVQDRSDDFDWDRGTDLTPSGAMHVRPYGGSTYQITGPNGAKEGSHYLFMEASEKSKGQTATLFLEGSMFKAPGKNCIRFFYNMNGFHTGSLSVFTDSGTAKRTLLSLSGDKGPAWRAAAVDITDMDSLRDIGIEATASGKFSSDIAIDDITVTMGKCSGLITGVLWQCSFETAIGASSLCNMLQDERDNFDWIVKSGTTKSLDTGPSDWSADNYYIYMEASPMRTLDTAVILLPVIAHEGEVCVEFQYNMYGHHMGSLLLITRGGTHSPTDSTYWKKDGNQGNTWHHAKVTVVNWPSLQRIGFMGVAGTGHTSDIAVDNILVLPGPCNGSSKDENNINGIKI